LKRIQHLRFSHICCSAMGATQSIPRVSVPIVCSTSPVSHQRHRINRASSTNRYQPTTRRTRTLSNTFRRHLSLSVSRKFSFISRRVHATGRKGKSIADKPRGKEKFLFFRFSFLNQRAAGERQENLSQKRCSRVCSSTALPVFTSFFFTPLARLVFLYFCHR
jgi:hypothetical protein